MSSSKIIAAKKPSIIAKNQIHTKDSGTPEVQVAILSEEINNLVEHLKINPKDNSSRRGLLRKVGRRKKILNYLLGVDRTRYLRTCKKNSIRPNMNLVNQQKSLAETQEKVVVETGI